MKKLAWMLATALLLITLCGGAIAETLGTKGELTADENGVINLTNNVTLSEKIVLSSGKNYNLQGNGFTLSHASGYAGTLFEIPATTTLTIDRLTIDGANSWTLDETKWNAAKAKSDAGNSVTGAEIKDMVVSNGTSVTASLFQVMGGSVATTNTTIQNLYTSGNSRLFYVTNGGSVAMNSGTSVKHCASVSDGNHGLLGIVNNGSVTMGVGCTVEDMFVACNGGMFDLESNANLTVDGATIKDVRSVNSNGQFAMVRNGSNFTMKSGTIKNFTGLIGVSNGRCGIVYLHAGNNTFQMNGGTISDNFIGKRGVVDAARFTSCKVVLNGGSITNNKTTFQNGTSYSVSTVCPVKLGANAIIDAPVYQFEYDTARVTDEGNHSKYLNTGVCRIDNVYYGTLNDAMNNIKNGETGVMIRDTTLADGAVGKLVSKTVTLDLNGKTITQTETDLPVFELDGATLQLIDTTRSRVSGQGGAGAAQAGYPNGGWLKAAQKVASLKNDGQLILLTYEGTTDTYTSNLNSDGSGVVPKTGDDMPLALLLAAMLLSSIALLLSRKQKAVL